MYRARLQISKIRVPSLFKKIFPKERYTDYLDELIDDIKEHGLQTPIHVIKSKHGDWYILLSGLRRLKAFKKMGRKTIPANIEENNT